jgi:hypothetical protein
MQPLPHLTSPRAFAGRHTGTHALPGGLTRRQSGAGLAPENSVEGPAADQVDAP